MKAIRNLLIFIILGFCIFLLFGWYSGFYYNAILEVREVNSFVGVYEDHIGEYSATKEIQENLYDMLWEDGIENFKNFGIYYDDPQFVEISEMRSKVGRIVENNQITKLTRFSEEYNIFAFERQKAAVVEIPYRNYFSLYAGIYKAYPLLNEYAKENGITNNSIIEIHDFPNKVIFILPLQKLN